MTLRRNACLPLAITTALVLAGCGSSSKSDSDSTSLQPGPDTESPSPMSAALIATVAPDFSSSDIEIVDLTSESLQAVAGYFTADQSDIVIDTYGTDFYRLGRFEIDNITKRNLSSPTFNEWQFSALGSTDTSSPNVQDLVFVSEEKAYLIRYESPVVWVVNPSVDANQEAEFKIAEIDLSAYADQDGIPELSGGVINDGKLFVIAQRLNRDEGWQPLNTSYVAVIDIETDTEVDTGKGEEGFKGIALQTRNPQRISAHDNMGVMVQSVGSYSPVYSGGIELIDPADFTSQLRVDDGDDENHPVGLIANAVIVSEQVGYLVGYAGWQDTSLYRFNPATGEVESEALTDYRNIDISALEVGPQGRLWVGVGSASAPRVDLLDAATGVTLDQLSLLRNPSQIRFAGE